MPQSHEAGLRAMLRAVDRGTISRRAFVRRLGSLGVGAPIAWQLLLRGAPARAHAANFDYKPTRTGGGGELRMLLWQGPTLLNPYLITGLKDAEASRLFYEPLAEWDSDGNLVPILAAAIPSAANGDVAADARSVVWRLKKDLTWHDGEPCTADDLVFTASYAADPATASPWLGIYRDLAIEKIDRLTIRLHFGKPVPFWATAFVGLVGMILPRHVFLDHAGVKSRDAAANLKPVGTGAYRYVDFRPGDLVRGEINPKYHLPRRPHFDAVEMKGSGDAVSAARAVLQTGEADFGWNLQVEDELLRRLEQGGRGRVEFKAAGVVEHILVNMSDPWTEVDGERASPKSRHPVLADPAVREALNLLLDRKSIEAHVFGRGGTATGNFLNAPARFRPPGLPDAFDVERAKQVLAAGGWQAGADGIRVRDGKALRLAMQSSINSTRQKVQAIFKQACQKAGIELTLKAITPSVFFSGDAANPDTASKFYCDLELLAIGMGRPDPGVFMNQFCSWEVASKANQWAGRNLTRWRSDDYDRAYRAAETELDPVRRAALFIRMNELAVASHVVLPVADRPLVHAFAASLRAPWSGWTLSTAMLQDWYRET